jgi:hypothetical protein
VSDTFVNDPPALPGPAASWAPGEKPVGDANSVLPQSDFMGDVKGHDAQIGVVQGQLAVAAEKAKTRGSFVDDQAADRAKTYQQEMERSYSLERASANDPSLKPWNADKEHSDRVRGPIEQFGSLGTIFAMAASAFTRQPMVSALNAGAAAMTAMKNADEEGYKHAFEAWKDNSQLAIKRFDMERTMFEDVNKLATSNVALWRQKRAAVAAQFDDQKTLALLNAGLDPEVLKLDAEKTSIHGKLLDNSEKMLQMNREQDLYTSYIKAHMPEAKTPLDQLKVKAGALQAVLQARRGGENPEDKFNRMMALEQAREAARSAEGKEARQAAMDRLVATIGSREQIAGLTDERIRELSGNQIDSRERLEKERAAARAAEGDKNRTAAGERLETSEAGREGRQQAQITGAKERAEIGAKGKQDARKVGPASDAVFKANEEAREKAEKGDFGSPPDLKAMHDWEANRASEITGGSKFYPIDQSIVNEIHKNYQDGTKKREDIKYMDKSQQTKMEAVFSSRENLERVSQYTRDHPDAIGYVAALEKNVNLDKYQDLFQKANGGDKAAGAAAVAAINSEFDRLADGRLQPTQAAKAKILNKMITTQAFSDAAIAGSRGGTIYLDRAFREIYDQSSSPAAFYGTLKERYIDADNFAARYGLGFDERTDKDKQPFWERFASPNRKSGAESSGPPASMLQEGAATPFGDKGWWILRNGKPVQVSPPDGR